MKEEDPGYIHIREEGWLAEYELNMIGIGIVIELNC